MSDCKMLVWEYQLVAQCLQMTSAQNLVKNSLSALLNYLWTRKTCWKSVQWVADLLCVPLCLPLACCLRVAELGAALWVLVHPFALSVCLPRGPVVLCSVSCAFCHKGFSGKSDSAPNMKTRPSFHIHHAEHWGCVMDRWASGILCFWQLGM